jgi:hypothetical protein
VANEAHYPHADPSGRMVCTPLSRAEKGNLTVEVDGRPRSPARLDARR